MVKLPLQTEPLVSRVAYWRICRFSWAQNGFKHRYKKTWIEWDILFLACADFYGESLDICEHQIMSGVIELPFWYLNYSTPANPDRACREYKSEVSCAISFQVREGQKIYVRTGEKYRFKDPTCKGRHNGVGVVTGIILKCLFLWYIHYLHVLCYEASCQLAG